MAWLAYAACCKRDLLQIASQHLPTSGLRDPSRKLWLVTLQLLPISRGLRTSIAERMFLKLAVGKLLGKAVSPALLSENLPRLFRNLHLTFQSGLSAGTKKANANNGNLTAAERGPTLNEVDERMALFAALELERGTAVQKVHNSLMRQRSLPCSCRNQP